MKWSKASYYTSYWVAKEEEEERVVMVKMKLKKRKNGKWATEGDVIRAAEDCKPNDDMCIGMKKGLFSHRLAFTFYSVTVNDMNSEKPRLPVFAFL
jgi:hypothetical protein